MKTSPKTKVKSHIGSILYPILYTLILFLVASSIYFYANGYRLDLFKQEITQTGVVTVESSPFGADIHVDQKLVGRTPKSTSLEIGTYHITVEKEGYYNWEKDVEIVEGKSTPIFPWLIKQDPKHITLWTSTGTIEKYWVNKEEDHIVFLTKETQGYSLWEYTLNPALWDFSPNPSEILKLESNNIEITLSPSGLQALLKVTSETTSQYYLLNTQVLSQFSTLKALDIDSTKKYKISWANDNNYLVLDSTSGIYSYDLKLNQTNTFVEKLVSQKYIWTTDEQGFFYIVEPSKDQTDNVYTYNLKQMDLLGNNATYLISNFYFRKADEYILQYRENGFTYSEFSSSPESTYSAGEITGIKVNQKAQGVYIQTSLATYWFNIQTQKFMMLSAYPATFIEFNEDHERLIFRDENQISVFTFDKTEGDHTVNIGSKEIKNIADISKTSDLHWLTDSLDITYLQEGAIYITDVDGDNKVNIAQPDNLLTFLIRNSNNTLLTFTKDEANKLSITELEIH
ncbi:PEGA domain-containing protein [Patescibacteria group bacterium]|nr:PEGA domain-containing protein [Patescibacteria group bacterium]